MELKEALLACFTDDPVNWLKWIAVFAVFIGSYFVAVPLYGKVSYFLSRERKRDIARSRKHVIEAWITNSYKYDEDDWSGSYTYEQDGKTRTYRGRFRGMPPRVLYLYYLKNPRKVFSVDDLAWEAPKGLVLLPIVLAPFLLGALMVFLLKVDISGFN